MVLRLILISTLPFVCAHFHLFSAQALHICGPNETRYVPSQACDPGPPGTWGSKCLCLQVVVDLGKFNTEEEAAAAYDRASVWCLGLTSRLNFPAEQQIGGVGSPVSLCMLDTS